MSVWGFELQLDVHKFNNWFPNDGDLYKMLYMNGKSFENIIKIFLFIDIKGNVKTRCVISVKYG